MPANYGILYEEVFGVSPKVAVTAVPPEVFICPVDGEEFSTEEAMLEHIKTAHPWHWHFWYAPYGKPLLAFTGVGVAGLVTIVLSKAFPPVARS